MHIDAHSGAFRRIRGSAVHNPLTSALSSLFPVAPVRAPWELVGATLIVESPSRSYFRSSHRGDSIAASCRISAAFRHQQDSLACRRPRVLWAEAFRTVRAETERRAAPLSPEDQIVQSMPDASPTKWHRAHTTWFFEQFLLKPHAQRLSRVRRALRVSVQLLLCRGRSAARAAGARPDHAAECAGGRGLSRPCRSRGRSR